MKGDIKPIEFMARQEDWNYGISLFARQVTIGCHVDMAQPLVFERMPDNAAIITTPFMQLTIDQATQLMNELWHCGVRPSRSADSATGQLAAMDDHLGDMRKIAFKLLDDLTGTRPAMEFNPNQQGEK